MGSRRMQIATSSLAAEALKLTNPATAFSRRTEAHNQDKVSMGTIAARDARSVVDLARRRGHPPHRALPGRRPAGRGSAGLRARSLHAAVRKSVPTVTEDRRQDVDIEEILALHRSGELPIGELAPA